ncbi:MAG TPA: ATP-binding protein [Polyangiaceae bacterium]|nr:ATP-binding protein [Polyangiaceae bacterium]
MVIFSEAAKIAVDTFVTPVWVIELERAAVVWANRAALALFAADTLEELLAREQTGAANAFLVGELARLKLGARLESEFRVRQPGVESMVTCTFTGIRGEVDQKLSLVEAHVDRHSPTSLRVPEFEQRLQSRDRMASIGTLTAGVVHGINNPLSYVIANLEYVKRLLSPGAEPLQAKALAELSDVVDDSLDGAERVRRIVCDLGSFSRTNDGQVMAVELERAAERALSVAANEIRHRARIVREYTRIPAALGTEAQLAQVILNVLINAAHSIETGAVDRNAITVRTLLDAQDRPMLEIEDTGCGIAKENLKRVFDPFFTTKPVGVGTGLGLSIADRIVRELGGEIALESVHGLGTRVRLALPAAPLTASVLPVVESVPPLLSDRPRARVLVIDDEPAILRAFRRVLYAHDVVVALSGAEAMSKFADGRGFDVIFCDVMMPEMSGMEVYRQIRERHPGQQRKLVFMTGGAFVEPAAHFIESVANPTLKKPFTGSALRALVAALTRSPLR